MKGVVHITGGGMTDNIPRVIPKHLGVELDTNSYKVSVHALLSLASTCS